MASGWALTPVAYANVPFSPDMGTPWVRLAVINGESETAGITGSAPMVRDRGLVACQIFVDKNAGTDAALGYADAFLALFEHKRFDGILTYSGSVATTGVSDGWYQLNVTIPFRRVRNV